MKKAAELPMSTIVFIIIIIIAAVIILLWHFSGTSMFKKLIGNVTCNMVNNTSGGEIQTGC
jgi:hypothetical protein